MNSSQGAAAALSIIPFLNKVNKYILNPILLLAFAVAMLMFIFGIIEFIAHTDSEESRERGRRNIMWGLIGMLVMVSVYGIIGVILQTFSIQTPTYPAGL